MFLRWFTALKDGILISQWRAPLYTPRMQESCHARTHVMRITYGTGGWLPVAAGEHDGGPLPPRRLETSLPRKRSGLSLSLSSHLAPSLTSFFFFLTRHPVCFSLSLSCNTCIIHRSVSPSLPPAVSLDNLPTIPRGATTRWFVDPAHGHVTGLYKAGQRQTVNHLFAAPRLASCTVLPFFCRNTKFGVYSISAIC